MVSVSPLFAMPTGVDNEDFQEVRYRKHAKYVRKQPVSKTTNRKKCNRNKAKQGHYKSEGQKQSAKKTKTKARDEGYDITTDNSITVAEVRVFPDRRLLDARDAVQALLRNALLNGVGDEEALFDSLYDQQYKGFEDLHYAGVTGDFLAAIRSGLDLLTLASIPLDEGSASQIAFRAFIEELKRLRKSIAETQDASWDVLSFRLEAFQEYAEAFFAHSRVFGFNEMLGLLDTLNAYFIKYLEQALNESYLPHEDLLGIDNEGAAANTLLDATPVVAQPDGLARGLLQVWGFGGCF